MSLPRVYIEARKDIDKHGPVKKIDGILEPPCKTCLNFSPRVRTDALGDYAGEVYCIATQYKDFSCYEARSPKKESPLTPISPSGMIIEILKDGDTYCACTGYNLQEGLAGFGKLPMDALRTFIQQYYNVVFRSKCLNDDMPCIKGSRKQCDRCKLVKEKDE